MTLTPEIELFFWILHGVLGLGCAFFCWETIMNLKQVPAECRPAFLKNELVVKYGTAGIGSTMFLPLFAVWKWGWIGIFSYQVYPGAALLLGFLFYFATPKQAKTS